MVILQIIDYEEHKMCFIKVDNKYVNLCKRINGRFLREPGHDTDLNTIFNLLGSGTFKVSSLLGSVVDSPAGCSEFYTFYYS